MSGQDEYSPPHDALQHDPRASLAAASAAHARSDAGRPKGHHRRLTLVALSVVAASAVGTATTCSGRFSYRCGAVIRIEGPRAREHAPIYRRELLDFAWIHSGPPSSAEEDSVNWSVDSPDPSHLRYSVIEFNRAKGVGHVRGVAERFLDHVRREQNIRRSSPSASESQLQLATSELETRLEQATNAVSTKMANLQGTDPAERRSMLIERWDQLRTSFLANRTRLQEKARRVERLKQDGRPTEGETNPESRRQAYADSRLLQQDSAELRVNLSETKLLLLNVWQSSSDALQQLVAQAESAVVASSTDARDPLALRPLNQEVSLAESCIEFQKAIENFRSEWEAGFTAIKDSSVDPLDNTILQRYDQLRETLRRFTFRASRILDILQEAARSIADAPGEQSRHHVRHSELIRVIRHLSTSFQRFELESSRTDPRENFKLDASLRASRGLTRRCKLIIADIDTKLAVEAHQRAIEQYESDVQDAERDLERLRREADASIAKLIELQTELNINSQLNEAFLRNSLGAEAAKQQAELAQRDLAKTKALANEMRAARLATVEGTQLEIIQSDVLDGPVNLPERLWHGAVAAIVTFFSMSLGFWWLGRRH